MGSLCSRHATEEHEQRDQMQRDALGHEKELRKLEKENNHLSQVNLTILSEQKEQRIRDEIGQNYRQLFPEQFVLSTEIIQFRSKVLLMRPGQSEFIDKNLPVPDRLYISLFGETGIGKTSLVNSLICSVEGKLSKGNRLPTAPKNYQGAHSLERLNVSLTKHLSVVDNRGINTERSMDSSVQDEVIKHLEGRYPKGVVEWTPQSPAQGIVQGPKSYCTVLVVSAHHSEVVPQYKSFIDCLRKWQGRFPIAVVTRCDECSSENVRLVLHTLGIGEIYDVANITAERRELSAENQYHLLQLIERCFIDGDRVFFYRQRFDE